MKVPFLTSSAVTKLLGKIAITVLAGGLVGGALVRWAPGFGIDEEELDSRLSRESIETLRHAQDREQDPAAFYFGYLRRLLHGDLGTSITLRRPVAQLIAERFPETLKSMAWGLGLGWTLGFGLAVAAVLSRSWCVDLMASLCAGVLLCLPAAVLALLFVLANAPVRLILGLIICPKVFRYSRSLLQRSLSSPCVITAHAKGLGKVRVFLWHMVVPAAPQLAALAGLTVSLAFTTAIPVEALCDLPGIGQLAWKAALGRDVLLLVNLTMIVTLVTLVANSASDFLGVDNRREQA